MERRPLLASTAPPDFAAALAAHKAAAVADKLRVPRVPLGCQGKTTFGDSLVKGLNDPETRELIWSAFCNSGAAAAGETATAADEEEAEVAGDAAVAASV